MSQHLRTEGSESYALATGNAGAPRLDLQDRFLFENSQKFLDSAGLKQGMTVMDVGCGIGLMTTYLAKEVGPEGRVIAVDISAAQLALATQRVQAAQLSNVQFIHGDFTQSVDIPLSSADLVNIRFVLMHLTDPVAAAARVKSFLKPHGVACFQEPIKSTLHCTYETAAFADYMQALVTMSHRMGVDFEIGERLPQVLTEAGFDHIDTTITHQEITLWEGQQLCKMALVEMTPKLLATQSATQAQITHWTEVLDKMPTDDPSHTFKIAKQVYATALA